VFYNRVRETVEPSKLPALLAHVMANEIAHVLEGTNCHSGLDALEPGTVERLVGEVRTAGLRVGSVGGCRETRGTQRIDNANDAHWCELKPWLLALSSGKCWFSEVRDLFSHPEVEHFRPKTMAKSLDGIKRDGYWWLAFSYMNFRVCGNVGNRKKGIWFPLSNGSVCSTYANRCEESETHYLLDPIDASDVSLIAFDEEGKVIPVPVRPIGT